MKGVTAALAMAGLISTVLSFSGCTAAHTAIKKRNLDVQTKMSETIFLEPVAPSKRVIYVDVRNTSDKDMNVKETVYKAIRDRGYTITDNPEEAYYMLQANVLQVGKSDLRNSKQALDGGFGGAVLGAGSAYAISSANRDVAVAAVAGAVLGVVGDALVDDVYYTMITDIQIRERPQTGERISQSQSASIRQGSSTSISQSVSGTPAEWKTYRTRIVSTANKVNLEFEEAQPALQEALAKSLSGLF
jgi:outer membrane lipoprotein SlyB